MAYTTVPAAGSTLRALVLSALVTEVRPLEVYKSINETVNGSAVLQADDHLLLVVEANRTYLLDSHLYYFSGTTPDFKIQWTAPSGAALTWGGTYYNTSAAVTTNGNFALGTTLSVGGTGGDAHAGFFGTLITGATAGTFTLTWAQDTSNASNTVLYANSSLKLTPAP